MGARPLPVRLGELAELVGRMCADTGTAMSHASTALVDGRERLAHQVISGGAVLEGLQERMEILASEALLQNPVAGDLRAVVATIRCASDVERMNRLAVHVARTALRHGQGPGVPTEVAPTIRQMAQNAVALARKAGEVARTRNVLLGVELEADDDAMDQLNRRMFSVMMHPSWPHGVATAVDVTLLSRYYERFGDHAVKVARQTVYAVTGSEPASLPL
jgi:phosphate transport system protein